MKFIRKWQDNTNTSILWKHFAMMVCVLLISVIGLVVTTQRSMETLTDEMLSKYQETLNRDCREFNEKLSSTSALPGDMEGIKHYDYIKGVTSGTLEKKYNPVLSFMKEALANQVYLRGDSAATILYMSNCNSIVTNVRVYPKAEDCYDKYILFSKTGTEIIMGYLRERSLSMLLPMQPVKIGGHDYSPHLALIIHPTDSDIAVMTLYSEQTIQDLLGFSHMPEGSCLQLIEDGGQILYQYPQTLPEQISNECYLLTGELENYQVSVNMYIPRDFFSWSIRPTKLMSICSILLVLVMGLILSSHFSKASVQPIWKIIKAHSVGEIPAQLNELSHLDQMLYNSSMQSNQLKIQLTKQILARALSGSILSETDEQYLEQSAPNLFDNYCVAIFHAPVSINNLLGEHLQCRMESRLIWTILNPLETGALLDNKDGTLSALTELVQELNEKSLDGEICCGVSTSFCGLSNLHVAARQAKISMPQSARVNVFSGDQTESTFFSRLQQERLYQNISESNKEGALRILENISKQVNQHHARYVFYNICFVLHNVAEEMGVILSQNVRNMEYIPSQLPKENIRRCVIILNELFEQIEQRTVAHTVSCQEEILSFVRRNFADSRLCAAYVATQLDISEKRVYETVRNNLDMSFNEYLLSVRMKHAAVILCSTNNSISEVAKCCGYLGESTFYRLFRKYYGISPGQYRKDGGIVAKQEDGAS